MKSKLIFIYDGECPFCNQFAELLELKSKLPNLEIKNARERPNQIPDNYDMDIKGAILLKDGQFLNGAAAIYFVCKEITEPSDQLLKLLISIFASEKTTKLVFPFLILGRRILLLLKGVPRKLKTNTSLN